MNIICLYDLLKSNSNFQVAEMICCIECKDDDTIVFANLVQSIDKKIMQRNDNL